MIDPANQLNLAQSKAAAAQTSLDPNSDYGDAQLFATGAESVVFDSAVGGLGVGMAANAADSVEQIKESLGGKGDFISEQEFRDAGYRGEWRQGMSRSGADILDRNIRGAEKRSDVLRYSVKNPGDMAINFAGSFLPGMITSAPINFVSKMLFANEVASAGIVDFAVGKGLGRSFQGVVGTALRSAGTGLVEVAAEELLVNRQVQEAIGRKDYDLEQSLNNIALAPVFAGAVGAIASSWHSSASFRAYAHLKDNASAYEAFTGIPFDRSHADQVRTDASMATQKSIRDNFKGAVERLMKGESTAADENILGAGFESFHADIDNRLFAGDMTAAQAAAAMDKLSYKLLDKLAEKVTSLSAEQGAIKKLYEKTFGREIVFFDRFGDDSAKQVGGRVWGGRPGRMYIAKDLKGSLLGEVVGHEFGHSLKWQAPDVWHSIVETLNGLITPEELTARLNSTGRSQGNNWKAMPNYKKMDEAAVDMFSEKMNTPELWRRLYKLNPKAFGETVGYLKQMFERFKKNADPASMTESKRAATQIGNILGLAQAQGRFDGPLTKHWIWNDAPGEKPGARIASMSKRLYKSFSDKLQQFRDMKRNEVAVDGSLRNEDRLMKTVNQEAAPQYMFSVVKNEPWLLDSPGFNKAVLRLDQFAKDVNGVMRLSKADIATSKMQNLMNATPEELQAMLKALGVTSDKPVDQAFLTQSWKMADELAAILKDTKDNIQLPREKIVYLKDPDGKISFYRFVDEDLKYIDDLESIDYSEPAPIEHPFGREGDIVFSATHKTPDSAGGTGAESVKVVSDLSLSDMTSADDFISGVEDFLDNHPDIAPSDKNFLRSIITMNGDKLDKLAEYAKPDNQKAGKKFSAHFKEVIGNAFDRIKSITEAELMKELVDNAPSRSRMIEDKRLNHVWRLMESNPVNDRVLRHTEVKKDNSGMVISKGDRKAAEPFRDQGYIPDGFEAELKHPGELLAEAQKHAMIINGRKAIIEALDKELLLVNQTKNILEYTSPENHPVANNIIYNAGNRAARLMRAIGNLTDQQVLELSGFVEHNRQDMYDHGLLADQVSPDAIGIQDGRQIVDTAFNSEIDDMPIDTDGSGTATVKKGVAGVMEKFGAAAKKVGDILDSNNLPKDPARRDTYLSIERANENLKARIEQLKTPDAFDPMEPEAAKKGITALARQGRKRMIGFLSGDLSKETAGVFGSGDSLSGHISALKKDAAGHLSNIISKHFGYTRIEAKDEAFNRALWDAMETGAVTKDPLANELAAATKLYYDLFRATAKKNGIDIGEAQHYVVPQRYDRKAVSAVSPDEWIQDTLSSIDEKATLFNIKKNNPDFNSTVSNHLYGLYKQIVDGSYRESDSTGQENLGANSKELVPAHRVLVFKPGSSYDYTMKYGGHRSAWHAISSNILRRQEAVGMLDMLGKDPKKTFYEGIAEAGMDLNEGDGLKLKNIFEQVTGDVDAPVNNAVSEIGQWVRTVTKTATLGLGSVTAAFSDWVNTASVRSFIGGAGYAKTARVHELFNMVRGIDPTSEFGMHLSSLGAGAENFIASLTGSSVRSDIEKTYFSLNGMSQETRIGERAYTYLWARTMADFVKDPSLIDAQAERTLARYGLSLKDVEKTAGALMTHKQGTSTFDMLDHNLIADPTLRRKWKNYLEDTLGMAIMRPSDANKAFWKFGTKAGTPFGEAVRIQTQFADWASSAVTRGINRFRYGYGAEGFRNMIATGQFNKGGIQYMAYASSAVLAGWLCLNVKEVLKGREPIHFLTDKQRSFANLSRIMTQSGAAPVVDSLLADLAGGRMPAPSIGGPLGSQLVRVAGSKNIGEAMAKAHQLMPFNQVDAFDNGYNIVGGMVFGDAYEKAIRDQESWFLERGQRQLGL